MEGIHHIHKRKRAHHKLKEYPHSKKWIRFLDKFLLVVAVVGPLLVLPQILKIYVGQNASGVSALSWGLLALFNIPWIVYGVVHKDKPITLGYSIWFVVNIIVVVGALIY
jgi:uncharacterized protein with PQ loop repeat